MPCFRALTALAMVGTLAGCSRPDPSSQVAGIGNAGAAFLINAPGNAIQSVTGLRHKGYCAILNTQSVRWPKETLQTVERKVTKGILKLKSGQQTAWDATAIFPKGKWNGDVIWYFHGLCDSSDFTLGSKTRGALHFYEKFGTAKPIVVGLSLGDDWLLNEELDLSVWDILTGLQRTWKLPRKRNLLFGFSMGGFNALRLYEDSTPAIRFERCVIVSPCLPNCDPYASREVLRRYYLEPEGTKFLKEDVIRLARQFFPDSATWEAANPLANPTRYRNKPLLLLAGDEDIFGFQLTARKLASETGSEFVLFQGKHHIPGDDKSVGKMVHFFRSK